MSSKIKKNPIALNLPGVVALLIVYCRRVILAMTDNPWFPAAIVDPSLATVTADADALEAAEVVARGGAKGTAAARDLKRKAVEDDLLMLKAVVQGVASQHPAEAAAIIESAAMSPKKYTPRRVAPFEALRGLNAGSVILRVKCAGKRVAYEWQWSADGGKTWGSLPVTTAANTAVQGLGGGTTYQFRFRTTIRNVTGDWSQPVSFAVY